MKMIWKAWAVIGLLLVGLSVASAAPIVFGNDTFKFTGDTYIDISGPTTIGIGRVDTINQGSSTIWTSGQGGAYLNFVFGGFTSILSPTAPIFNFVATGGFVDFYTTNNASVFDTSIAPSAAIAAISGGNLFMKTIAVGQTVGIATGVSYSANGFLDAESGPYAAQLDTDTRLTFLPGLVADMSFGLVGSNNQNPLVNPAYTYISSTDLQGASVPVPEPSSLMILGLGLLWFGITSKPKQPDNYRMMSAA